MRKQSWFRTLSCCLMVVAILASGVVSVAAAPPPPVLVGPGDGSTVIEPVLKWQLVKGAAYYKVELSLSPSFVPIAHTYTTYNTWIVPVSAINHATFYWRVSAVDAGDNVGTPSAYWSFIKNIPAPVLVGPANGSTLAEPTLEWKATEGAAYYKVDLSTSPTFVTLDLTYTTYNTRIIPVIAFDHNTPWYWRVSGVDAEDHVGTVSVTRAFTKTIAAPVLVSPANGSTLAEPTLEWQVVEGAAYYKIDLSTSPTFVTLNHTYTTYNTRLIPVVAIDHSTPWYWRVSGVDAEDNVGTPSLARAFTKTISAPVLVSPANGSAVIEPVLEWQTAQGAAYYKVELSTSPSFVPIAFTYTTYNTHIKPVGAIAHATYYWRVSGVDAEDHVGTPSEGRTITKNLVAPVLVSPANGNTVTEPTLEWQAVEGAAYYKVELSIYSNFVPISYTYTTYNTRLTPAGKVISSTYYWRVSGVDAEDNVGTASAALILTIHTPPTATDLLPLLVTPADLATLTADPVFQWTRVISAADYRLVVSQEPDFSPLFDYAYLYYSTFTPYKGSAGQQWTYPNGVYYWRVEARNGSGTVIATSLARTFTKTMSLPLVAPADNALLTTDPTYQWTRILGAHDFRLVVSQDPDFSPLYDYAYPDYISFTPYKGSAGQQWAYPNDVYYWKVEARDHDGNVIVTSVARTFTKTMTLPLVAPADNTVLTTDPTYQWSRVVGAHDFRVFVSQDADFSPLNDYAYPDYLSFTPYKGLAGQQYAYANGVYYWKVEARDNDGNVLVTSVGRTFTKTTTLPLVAPADNAVLTTDPTYQWSRVVGAHDFRVFVSKDADFSPIYDYAYPNYLSFTPYKGSAGQQYAYANGVYYWKVEARDHDGNVLVTSVARTFTKTMTLPLIAPENGSLITTDPTFQWTRVLGAHDFRIVVSKYPGFSPIYDYVYPDYVSFTPYMGSAGQKTVYDPSTYYWKVEARDHDGNVIVTSEAWTFIKGYKIFIPMVKKN